MNKVTRRNPNAIYQALGSIEANCKTEIAVGFPHGKQQAYPDGTPVEDVAASHVYGLGVPQRDFMALALVDLPDKIRPFLEAIGQQANKKESRALQEAAGQQAVSVIQQAITDLDTPPNAPATIAKKGSSNPLIDTGHMRTAVTYVIRSKTR